MFPHRALEVQKLWMRRQMHKPYAMSYRIFDSEVVHLNNSLIYFPMVTNANLFMNKELLELLEWSIPQKWRSKFDLANYIPVKFNCARLMQECKAIEQSEKLTNPKQKKMYLTRRVKVQNTQVRKSTASTVKQKPIIWVIASS